MADEEAAAATEVVVMEAAQVTQLINAIVTAIGDLGTTLSTQLTAINTNLGTLNTNLNALKTQLNSDITALGSTVSTSSAGSRTDVSGIVNAISDFKDEFETSLATVNTKLENLKTQITSHSTNLTSSLTGLGTKVETVGSKLECDVDPSGLYLTYGSRTGVKSIAYIAASRHVLNLKKVKEEEDGDSGDDSGSDSSSQDPDIDDAINQAVRESATTLFEDYATYEFGVTEDERMMFKTQEEFDASRKGLAFDYTRMYHDSFFETVDDETVNKIEGTEPTEYALLVFESLVKTSEKAGENDVKRMKNWVDRKVIQTVVITKNTSNNTCLVYFPTQDSYDALDTETYKSEKDAMDAIVKKYQETLDDKYKGIAFIPAGSIERGITLEEYRTRAKNITPTCEYT